MLEAHQEGRHGAYSSLTPQNSTACVGSLHDTAPTANGDASMQDGLAACIFDLLAEKDEPDHVPISAKEAN